MGYTANHRIEEMYDASPLNRTLTRITDRMLDQLKERVAVRTPRAATPPGLSTALFSQMRGRPPGTLKESWYRTPVESGVNRTGTAQRSGEVLTDDPIGPLVEWPTRPHVIRPRPDRAPATVVATRRPRRAGTDPMAHLAWRGPGGRMVFAREVHHPGTEGVHMMRDSLAELDATWQRIGDEEMVLWAREQEELTR